MNAPDGISLRAYRPDDLARLVEIDRATTRHLAAHGFPSLLDAMPDEGSVAELVDGRAVWVAVGADDRPLGFAVASDAGPCLYLHELGVDPAEHRRGIGTMLLDEVVRHGRWLFQPALALDTFRTVPFNAPFYAERGFMPWPPGHVPPEIEGLVKAGRPPGIHPASRVVMVKRL